ncbi:ester cyclase [Actinomadura sp. HBU206391]|uniref:ester cyclase n=1 Tax=Actinomadura sp. HBU206391 TaxID=2731692 RepID=UPI0016503739|nr:nuclear transport factor 2 family protein [Actinomadura sp. HBU206391]MBC6458931.1 nuclear transport factor 2 family protein [Actinomadura sp. HBU206391]
MSDAREVKERLFRALNAHDLSGVLECYSPDAVLVSPAGIAEGRDQIAWYYEHFLVAFADYRITAWQHLPCGDTVLDIAVNEWTISGTHTGPFILPDGRTAEATGRKIAVRGAGLCAIENGEVVTNREYYDQLELYTQLGFGLT